ncbi:MAG: DEAD/DEAH box helicase family protein [Chloroflexi bacterium]|nr:DEAD/DEAH box helicase family protein [Chloroflexota bacterium]
MPKEAQARIKINKLLADAGWRFFDDASGPANVRLESHIKLTRRKIDSMGDDFEQVTHGFVDFLLLGENGRPLLVLEAKAENKDPLIGKEQARTYAYNQNCRFVILSNGNLHYFWDLESGNPHLITSFPRQESVTSYAQRRSNPRRLYEEVVANDYIALTQLPTYASEAGWKNELEREDFIRANRLRFLRKYQLQAIEALQAAAKAGQDRYLFEMATGTGKTLTAAAVIKLFLRTGNARRVLFLVDRLELESQAYKAFRDLLANDYQTVIYKENRDDWRRAEIVVSTVQSLLFNNKYQGLFSPTDFDLVISDEAHRSIGGNARAVFDYFIGYKLGLTATPKDYLKHYDQTPGRNDPRETERRLLLDTYRTFGCESGQPTFRYSLQDGVRDGYLINPLVVDARTEITTKLLSDRGLLVDFIDEEGREAGGVFTQTSFEKRFFSEATNRLFCKLFLQNALRDPVSGEMGKSIIFAVSQHHASKLVQILNEFGDQMYPGKYRSDFAVQVTSLIPDAQQMSINFANNNLMGSGNFNRDYLTSKARICVTVGMMTTGYDCTDLLNLGLFRPIFSPTDFIQIKGRGTRKHTFTDQLRDEELGEQIEEPEKTAYKLFDFFATCEYFEEDYQYDAVLELPKTQGREDFTVDAALAEDEAQEQPGAPKKTVSTYEYLGGDALLTMEVEQIEHPGMKIDRMFFQQFEEAVKADPIIVEGVEQGQWERVKDYMRREVLNKPEAYYTLDKLRRAAGVDRRLDLREILEHIFGMIPRFKTRAELLDEEFSKFVADIKPTEAQAIPAIRAYFNAYLTSKEVQRIVDAGTFAEFATNPVFSMNDFGAVPAKYRKLVPEYIKDYVSLNTFIH